MSSTSGNVNSVFYADTYHPIQAGSIDGTDILPHDNGVYRALICSSTGLYDPFRDPKVIGDPYCTLFVGRLSHLTNEETLRKAMSRYGRVKSLRLVRHIVFQRNFNLKSKRKEEEFSCLYSWGWNLKHHKYKRVGRWRGWYMQAFRTFNWCITWICFCWVWDWKRDAACISGCSSCHYWWQWNNCGLQ